MSVDRRSEILAELGRSDEVAVAERLKAEAVAFGAVLDDLPGGDGQLTREHVQNLLALTSEASESFLSVALSVVEYAAGAALETLPRVLRQVAVATAAGCTDHTARRVAAVPAVGRVIWALAAFALHCDRLAALVALARARIRVPFDNDVEPVIALITFRHPDAFGQDAGVAFSDYHDWLAGRDLLGHYSMFRGDLEPALLEADLVLAMFAARFRHRTYSRGHARDAVRRLTARVADAAQRPALEELFPGEGTLEERLERAYAVVEGDRHRFERGPATLFGSDD